MQRSHPAMLLRGVHVLLIEDHADSREVGRIMLTHLGARVDVAEDGERGLACLEDECPDVVFCDLAMPHMDGFEFARRVRRLASCAHVRLIALTGLGDDNAYLQSWSAGYDAHLEKPITFAKLNAIAERLLLGQSAPPQVANQSTPEMPRETEQSRPPRSGASAPSTGSGRRRVRSSPPRTPAPAQEQRSRRRSGRSGGRS